MKISNALMSYLRTISNTRPPSIFHTRQCPLRKGNTSPLGPRSIIQRRFQQNPADNPEWESLLDKPVQMVRQRSRHGPGLIVLALIPLTAFALGTWQVQRLGWKTELIARFEDRLVRDPLPLPPHIDPGVISEYDYRRVYTRGILRHDQEMLIGPRIHDGENGYVVVTPLDRGAKGTKLLVNRGWISKTKMKQIDRPEGVPTEEVVVEGLLREPFKKNMFTPTNDPSTGTFYFPDVEEMAALTGSQPVWIEETMKPDLMEAMDREHKGIPIGRPAEVNLRNTHTQYIFTWYALSFATSVMLWMVVKKPAKGIIRRSDKW